MTFSQCGLLANKKSTISLASKKQFPPKHQIKFVGEMSSERIVFLDTEVSKGPRFAISKTLDVQTHFKPTETFHIIMHFSSCHPLSVKKGFIKGETLRLLRTNSVKENVESMKRDFQSRLLDRGYPLEFIESILTDIDFSSRKAALQTKPKTSKNLLLFVTTYNPATPNLKKILMKHWRLITDNPKLATIFPNTPNCRLQEGEIAQRLSSQS